MSDDAAPIFDDKAELRGNLDLTGAEWQRSDGESVDGKDIEWAYVQHTDGVTYTVMRNIDQPERPTLVFTPREWDAFLDGLKDGEFNAPW
jgi:hypothetical protein